MSARDRVSRWHCAQCALQIYLLTYFSCGSILVENPSLIIIMNNRNFDLQTVFIMYFVPSWSSSSSSWRRRKQPERPLYPRNRRKITLYLLQNTTVNYGFRGSLINCNYKKAVRSQRWPCNAPYTWVPWKFSGQPDYAHGYYSQHLTWAFVPIDPVNVVTKFEVRCFTRSWDNRGYPKNLGSPWIRPRSLFSKILMGFYLDWPCKCTRQISSP